MMPMINLIVHSTNKILSNKLKEIARTKDPEVIQEAQKKVISIKEK